MIWVAIVFIFLSNGTPTPDTVVGIGYGPTADRCEQLVAQAVSDAKQNPKYVGAKYTCNPVNEPAPPKVA